MIRPEIRTNRSYERRSAPYEATISVWTRPRYRADLDGLRALAVTAVILYHLGVGAPSGGFVGVDVFFVLSGFLITSLAVHEMNDGTFSLYDFYDRRIRRIVPALVVVLTFSAGASLFILFPGDLAIFGASLVGTALSVGNVVFARQVGYFAPNAELAPLLHSWSLAVEEQFYFAFPLLLWASWRWTGSWWRLTLAITLALSFSSSVYGVSMKPALAFYLLPSRAWEMIVGSLLALNVIRNPAKRMHREIGATLGVIAIVTSMLAYTKDTQFPGLAALPPCLGAGLFIWAGLGTDRAESRMAQLLGSPVPVFVGLISYSLYLWHWPLIVFTKHLTNAALTPLLQFALASATLALSIVSWRYVERPFREGRFLWRTRRQRYLGAGAASIGLALVGAVINVTHGLPGRMSSEAETLAGMSNDYSPVRARCHKGGSAADLFSETCALAGDRSADIIVLGDSHGVELSFALNEAAMVHHSSVRQVTASSCPPFIGFISRERPECAKYVAGILAALSSVPPSRVFVVAHYFNWLGDVGSDSLWPKVEATVQFLRAQGHSVVLVGATPPHPAGIPVPDALARWVQFGGIASAYRFALDRHKSSEIDADLARIAHAYGASYVALSPLLCPDESGCRGYKDGKVLYFDDNHLSLAGARTVTHELLAPAIWPRRE